MYVPSFHWLLVSLIYKGEYTLSVGVSPARSINPANKLRWAASGANTIAQGAAAVRHPNIVSQRRFFNPPHYWQQEEDTGQLHAQSSPAVLY